jgi:hypothetical protein
MDKFPRSQEAWTQAFHMTKVTNNRNDNVIIIVGHQIASSLSLSDLKHGMQTVLRQTNCFIKFNDWGAHLDSRIVGYIANLHPRPP